MANISPDKIKAQLERILASSEFMTAKQLSEFLRYVVERSLNGHSGSIKQYTIAVEALGYGADYDPQSNPTVRVHARQLRRALDQYYHGQGIEDPILIDIPKGGYVPVFLENSSPISEDKPQERRQASRRKADNAIAEPQGPSVAVLAFDCLNEKDAYGYIATGLTQEIIISLSRFPDFIVVGPLSGELLRKEGLGTRGIGSKYGVRFVLTGSTRTYGQMLRLTVQLIDTVSGQNLWGQTLDCSLQSATIKTCEENVVNKVTATLADSYGVIPRTLTKETFAKVSSSPSAYEAILRFYHCQRVLTESAQTTAIDSLEKALEDNPEKAPVMGLLGDLLATAYQLGYADAELLERAEILGRQGVALDPNCQPARFALACVHFLRYELN